MGGGKPFRPFAEGRLIDHALNLSRTLSDFPAVAVRGSAWTEKLGGVTVLLDDPAIEGPLAGVASALSHGARTGVDLALTLPCDAPLLPLDIGARLEAALAPHFGVAVAASGGRLHPICALWRVRERHRLAPYLASGARSVHGFAEACGMAVVDWEIATVDPFANVNTPQELAALQAAVRSSPESR